MEDLRLKRKMIEEGDLKTWARRGRAPHSRRFHYLKVLLKVGLRLTALRSRGERNAFSPVLQHIRFEFDTLPEAFHGFKMLHLTDLHADSRPDFANRISDRLRNLTVDLCVLTGDYRYGIAGTCQKVYPSMERILAGLNTRHGFVGILGNHDQSEMVPEFERMGVQMLVNESLKLRQGEHSLWLIGVDDPHYYGCDDLPGALLDVPQDAFKILLVHTPEIYEEAHRNGVHLYLCGHTHGGQVCLPFIGPVITHTNCPRKYVRGAWQYGNVKGYTSPGVGFSGTPARFLCPPELVLIELCNRRLARQECVTP